MDQHTWDLSFMYRDFQDERIAADMDAVRRMAQELRELLACDMGDTEKLEALMRKGGELSTVMDRLGSYAYLTLAVDAHNTAAMQMVGRLQLMENELSLIMSDVTRYVGSIGDLEDVIARSEYLGTIAFALREMKDETRHLIPAEVEPWILDMKLSGGDAFSQLRDKLDASLLVDYRGQQLPLSAVRGLAYDADASVRRDAYEAEQAAYRKIELPMSFCLNSIKQEARTLARAQGFDSVLDMTLHNSRMDRETLDAMFTAISEYLPHFRRYLRAKARLLGHEGGLPFYDLFAPVGSSSRTYTIEEAREKLMEEMGKFTPDMAAFIGHAFDSRWIDVYPREGKSGGAFCAGVHAEDRSLVMTNFQGSFSDVSTLAHELGHAWHNRCMAGLPDTLCHTPMPLAETASIFNETMLSYQVLKNASAGEKLTLLEAGLMEATQTVVDIYSRYLFESEVVETRADHAMDVEELKSAMLRAQDATYGDGLDEQVRHPYMWACKSHYYSSGLNFYNFPYAFGLLFGKGVFAQYLEKGDAFVDEYCRLLRSCGSDTVANVAASVGIDVHSVDFWRSSLEVVRRDIDTFCALCGEQG